MRLNSTIIRAGLLSGGGAALWTMFEYVLGWHNAHLETGAKTGFVAVIFPTAAILWALRATKRSGGGRMTMMQALTTGLAVSAISAVIGVAFFLLYYTAINPAFLDLMRARGQEVDVATQLVAVAVGSLIFGTVLSTVAGFFMRTREGAAP